MDHAQSSAQTAEGTEQAPQNEGLQARINELVAKQRQEEEARKAAEQRLLENTAQMAQMAMQAQQRQVAPAPVAPADPLAQYKDRLDPVMVEAIQAAIANTQRQVEAQYAPIFAQQAAQIAGFAVQAEAARVPGLPKEVSDRAANLAATWRSQGLNFPPGDAINFALGEYQRGQLLKAAPVLGYNPAAALPTQVPPGFVPPPPSAQARSTLPSNFDQLSRSQQNAALEASGALDQPL
jgi:hypothetical protein